VRAGSPIAAGRPSAWRSPQALLVAGFAALVVCGTLGLWLPWCHAALQDGEQPITLLDAAFTATSAVCVTGLSVVETDRFNFWGQLWLVCEIYRRLRRHSLPHRALRNRHRRRRRRRLRGLGRGQSLRTPHGDDSAHGGVQGPDPVSGLSLPRRETKAPGPDV